MSTQDSDEIDEIDETFDEMKDVIKGFGVDLAKQSTGKLKGKSEKLFNMVGRRLDKVLEMEEEEDGNDPQLVRKKELQAYALAEEAFRKVSPFELTEVNNYPRFRAANSVLALLKPLYEIILWMENKKVKEIASWREAIRQHYNQIVMNLTGKIPVVKRQPKGIKEKLMNKIMNKEYFEPVKVTDLRLVYDDLKHDLTSFLNVLATRIAITDGRQPKRLTETLEVRMQNDVNP